MTKSDGKRFWTRRGAMTAALALGVAASVAVRALAQSEVPEFALTARDIAEIHDIGERLHIALNGPARERFARFTGDNIGRLVRVTTDETMLNEAVVRLQIDSGLFSSRKLDTETRARLRKVLTGQ